MTQRDLIPDDARLPPVELAERDAEWLEARKKGKISRKEFTDAVKMGLRQTLNPPPNKEAYPAATNRVYQ